MDGNKLKTVKKIIVDLLSNQALIEIEELMTAISLNINRLTLCIN
jgi:hypothetical protein